MTKIFLILCFLLSLPISYCSPCTEKTFLEEGEDEYACFVLDTDSTSKSCSYDSTTGGCVEKECSEFDPKFCRAAKLFYEDNKITKNCMPTPDGTGCNYYSCDELESNCKLYQVNDDLNENCVFNSDGTHCELKTCTDSVEDCSSFTPYDSRYKCVSGDSGCKVTKKECHEFKPKKCHQYVHELGEKCILDSESNKCKLIHCEELSNTECLNYDFEDGYFTCYPEGDNCKMKECREFSEDVCETIKFSYPENKCKYSAENGCELYSCLNMNPGECEDFIPFDPLYKCYEENGRCTTNLKKCEELSEDQCDLYNVESILSKTKKKCKKKNGQCVLDSKKLEYSILFLILLFFLL